MFSPKCVALLLQIANAVDSSRTPALLSPILAISISKIGPPTFSLKPFVPFFCTCTVSPITHLDLKIWHTSKLAWLVVWNIFQGGRYTTNLVAILDHFSRDHDEPRHGWVTSDPSRLGAALRVTMTLRIPRLANAVGVGNGAILLGKVTYWCLAGNEGMIHNHY
jgi:hypothetical protein